MASTDASFQVHAVRLWTLDLCKSIQEFQGIKVTAVKSVMCDACFVLSLESICTRGVRTSCSENFEVL